MAASQRQSAAGDMVATQKNGQDLKDFARNAEMLTAMRSVETRLGGYLEQNKLIADKLTTQDFALSQVTDAAQNAREAIEQALASGRVDTLMQDLNGYFRNAMEGLNTRYGGKYLFSGGKIDTRPAEGEKLSDLTSLYATVDEFFHNDDFVVEAKIDESTSVRTGMLAKDIGKDLLEQFKTIQEFEESVDGPFTGAISDAQRDFLKGVLGGLDDVHSNLVNHAARNGSVQARVEGVKADLGARSDSLKNMIGDITDADMAAAATALQQAQVSVQAAAQVFLSLQDSSLLNVLR
jgi:flagellar hook-associated protein 3 FlgL